MEQHSNATPETRNRAGSGFVLWAMASGRSPTVRGFPHPSYTNVAKASVALAATGRPYVGAMHQIPLDEFIRRRVKWQTQPDRKTVITRDERGRRVEEWWSLGVCRLRTVRVGNEIELWADRGGRIQRHDYGKISFKTWDEWRPPVRPTPVEPDIPDWAE